MPSICTLLHYGIMISCNGPGATLLLFLVLVIYVQDTLQKLSPFNYRGYECKAGNIPATLLCLNTILEIQLLFTFFPFLLS